MKCASILNIGTELLVGHTLNTHANYLSKELNDLGYNVYYHLTVGDNPKRILEALNFLSHNSELIICTGGLGPTEDDITRSAIAEYCNLALVEDEQTLREIDDFFKENGLNYTKNNDVQALFPEGSQILRNPLGTAPGFLVECGGLKILALPGPPRELQNMLDTIRPMLAGESKKLYSEFIQLIGIGESECADCIEDIFKGQGDPSIGIYAGGGFVKLRLSTMKSSQAEASAAIDPVKARLIEILGKYIFSFKNESPENTLFAMLSERGYKISFAESCTGGLMAQSINAIAGASDIFELALVTYSNSEKVKKLGVNPNTLEEYGAVSEHCVLEMNKGLKKLTAADVYVSVSGIAGPSGGSKEKPVGTVFVAYSICGVDFVKKYSFVGNRDRIRNKAKNTAFFEIIKQLRDGDKQRETL